MCESEGLVSNDWPDRVKLNANFNFKDFTSEVYKMGLIINVSKMMENMKKKVFFSLTL